jgi:hypothetical protein
MPLIYRPWGELLWILDRLPKKSWQFLGCLSTEDRSLASWAALRSTGMVTNDRLIRITDPVSRYESLANQLMVDRLAEYHSGHGRDSDIVDLALFASAHQITSTISSISETALENVIFDISCLPKRVFFPLMKVLVRSASVRNLLVTYSVPEAYTDDPLAEDFGDWRTLPMFGDAEPEKTPEMLIINVGHLPMGLPDQVLHGPRMEVNLLFPFPNSPASYKKTWEFVWTIERDLQGEKTLTKHVNSIDVSDAFDHIAVVTEGGKKRALFAPYGPKPISLAMCLYAMLNDDPVYYTQPRVYHPKYSIGIQRSNGRSKVWSYLIKRDGQSYYQM